MPYNEDMRWVFLSLTLAVGAVASAQPYLAWHRHSADSFGGNAYAIATKADVAGNVYVLTRIQATGKNGYALTKFNSAGVETWRKQFVSGVLDQRPAALVVLPVGAIVAGTRVNTSGSEAFATGFAGPTGAIAGDMAPTFDVPTDSGLLDAAIGPDGNAYCAGWAKPLGLPQASVILQFRPDLTKLKVFPLLNLGTTAAEARFLLFPGVGKLVAVGQEKSGTWKPMAFSMNLPAFTLANKFREGTLASALACASVGNDGSVYIGSTVLDGSAKGDFYSYRLGANLTKVWAKRAIRTPDEVLKALVAPASGGVVMVGSAAPSSSLTLRYTLPGGGPIVWPVPAGAGAKTGHDVVTDLGGNTYAAIDIGSQAGITKYDPSGKIVWTFPYQRGTYVTKGGRLGFDIYNNIFQAARFVYLGKEQSLGTKIWNLESILASPSAFKWDTGTTCQVKLSASMPAGAKVAVSCTNPVALPPFLYDAPTGASTLNIPIKPKKVTTVTTCILKISYGGRTLTANIKINP
jgi:hypothetical protein